MTDVFFRQFDLVPDFFLKVSGQSPTRQIGEIAVCNSDFRISVSTELVKYWTENFSCGDIRHAVIPCTLHSGHFTYLPDENTLDVTRKEMGFASDDIILAYVSSWAQ